MLMSRFVSDPELLQNSSSRNDSSWTKSKQMYRSYQAVATNTNTVEFLLYHIWDLKFQDKLTF